jgi:hypothetical protein
MRELVRLAPAALFAAVVIAGTVATDMSPGHTAQSGETTAKPCPTTCIQVIRPGGVWHLTTQPPERFSSLVLNVHGYVADVIVRTQGGGRAYVFQPAGFAPAKLVRYQDGAITAFRMTGPTTVELSGTSSGGPFSQSFPVAPGSSVRIRTLPAP